MDSLQTAIKLVSDEAQRVLRRVDVSDLPADIRSQVALLRRHLTDARYHAREYLAADYKFEQVAAGKAIVQTCEGLDKTLLLLSSAGIFGPAEVAHISALVGELKAIAAD